MDYEAAREAIEKAAQDITNEIGQPINSVIRTQHVRAAIQERLNDEAMGGQAIVKEIKPGGYDITLHYPFG